MARHGPDDAAERGALQGTTGGETADFAPSTMNFKVVASPERKYSVLSLLSVFTPFRNFASTESNLPLHVSFFFSW